MSEGGDLAGVHETLGRHEQALENGRHEFARVKEGLVELSGRVKAVEPKSPDWLKVGAFVLSILIAVLAGWWKLSQLLNERPTKDEVNRERIEQQSEQKRQGEEIRAIHDQQIEQSATLHELQNSADKTNQRLDQLLSSTKTP